MAQPDAERLMAEIAGRWGRELAERLRILKVKIAREVAQNPALLDDLEYWNQIAREIGGDLMQRAYEITWVGAAAGEAAMGFAVEWRAINQAVLEYTRQYSFNLISIDGPMSIVATTREQMREIFVRWQRGELGDRGLPDLIQGLERLFGEDRAQRIAVTETTRLFAEGNLIAWRQGGKVTHKTWHTARDELVCPICEPLNNKTVKLDEAFSPPVNDWDGYSPPAHVNCRCALTCETRPEEGER